MPAKKPKKNTLLPKKNPLPRNPTLDDFLKRGIKPPTKGKKAPPDYDVIGPGMGYTKPTKKNPPRKITGKPSPLTSKPANIGSAKRIIKGVKKK